MAINDVFRLRAVWRRTTDGPAMVNAFYFRQVAALIFDTPEEDLVDAFKTSVQPAYVAVVTNTVALVEYQVAKFPDFLTSFIDDTVEEGGALTGDPMPARIAGVLSYRTADLSRRGRGRVFLPSPNEASNTAGAPTTSYLALVDEIRAELGDLFTDIIFHAGWEWRMFSPADQLTKAVTSSESVGRWGTQRDRADVY